jgi:hypothetical protein
VEAGDRPDVDNAAVPAGDEFGRQLRVMRRMLSTFHSTHLRPLLVGTVGDSAESECPTGVVDED